jgi:hypothetical protein
MVVLTVLVGSGAGMVGQSSSLDQFQSNTTESEKLSYIEENFTTGQENTTTVQLIVRGDDVLTKESMLDVLSMEQSLRDNKTVNATLAENNSIVGIPNIVAQAAISQERAAVLQQRQQELNTTTAELRGALTTLSRDANLSAATAFDQVRANTSVEFTDEDEARFQQASRQLRAAKSEQDSGLSTRHAGRPRRPVRGAPEREHGTSAGTVTHAGRTARTDRVDERIGHRPDARRRVESGQRQRPGLRVHAPELRTGDDDGQRDDGHRHAGDRGDVVCGRGE